jgi:hypothetical protein
MLTFLFWNLKSSNIVTLRNLINYNKVDVLMLAECPMLPATVLEGLNQKSADFFQAESNCPRIQLFTKFREDFVLPVERPCGEVIQSEYYTLRRLARPTRDEILLCGAHFPSKLHLEGGDLKSFTSQFILRLAEAERIANHTRTVLMGDLNMNPFEDGVVDATALHAVPSRRTARGESRQVYHDSYPYFYNPMWSHFGEKQPGHAGTYYFKSPGYRADHWNIYDQVLVRPALLDRFRDDDVKVLWYDVDGDVSLLNDNKRPNNRTMSDHLPILFQLDV